MAEEPTEPPKLEIDWLKTAAGALAAVTTAVLLSTLGAVGTLIGAALGSVAATVGSALYTQGLARSRHAMVKAQETARFKVGIAQAEVRRAGRSDPVAQEAHLELADERLEEAKAELDAEPDAAPDAAPVSGATTEPAAAPEPSWRERVAALSWRRIGVITAATFAAVVLAITAFEAVSGRSVSSYTGGSDQDQGTTIGGVTGDRGGRNETDQPQPSQSPSTFESPSESPSETPTPTPTPTPTAPEPTPTPTPTPTPSPTVTPSPTLPTLPTSSR